MTLAIIGTAGRGSDAAKLTAAHWRMMVCIAQSVTCTLGATRLVSGGSAFADHVAVQLYLDGHADHLTLHLPCAWKDYGPGKDRTSHWAFDSTAVGQRLNQLHSAFAGIAGVEPWAQIQTAIEKGAEVHVNQGGFLARNSDVAKAAYALLAFTFGPIGDEGGTAHTWRLFHKQTDAMFRHANEHYSESPCGCSSNIPDPVHAYHFDLTHRRLHRHVYEDPTTAEQRAEWAAEQEAREAMAAQQPSAPRQRTQQDIDNDLL